MAAYYNEHDERAAEILRELMKEGAIAPGDIDTRSIEDVCYNEIKHYTQCHFFAGIGIWSLALLWCGWPDTRPVWTASCPCQPFSAAGKGLGFADERHLWPSFYHLATIGRPDRIFGEQVASKDGLAWLDLVHSDMEAAGYAFGAADTCAAGFGAPHIRQRLYWVADADNQGSQGRREPGRERALECAARPGGLAGGLAIAHEGERGSRRPRPEPAGWAHAEPAGRSVIGSRKPGPVNGLWRASDWIGCRDEKWRPVEPGTFPLADAGTFRNRVAELRGAGNALNLAQAIAFIESVMELDHAHIP